MGNLNEFEAFPDGLDSQFPEAKGGGMGSWDLRLPGMWPPPL